MGALFSGSAPVVMRGSGDQLFGSQPMARTVALGPPEGAWG